MLLETRIGCCGVGWLVPGHMRSQVETMAKAYLKPQVIPVGKQVGAQSPNLGGWNPKNIDTNLLVNSLVGLQNGRSS